MFVKTDDPNKGTISQPELVYLLLFLLLQSHCSDNCTGKLRWRMVVSAIPEDLQWD